MGSEGNIPEESRVFAMMLVWKCTGCGCIGETGCAEPCVLPQKCPDCGGPGEDLVVVTED